MSKDLTLNELHNRLAYAKEFEPHKVAYYEQLITEAKQTLSIKEITKQLNTPKK